MSESSEKRRLIEQLEGLPTLPTIVIKIFECIDDPKSSAEDLKEIITNDVAISAKVLKLSNSAFFGFSQEILDITRAIVVLGFDTVVDIAVSVSLASLMSPREGSSVIPMEQIWEHNIAAGQAGRIIGKASNYPYLEQAFLIGLLHDIGKAILASYFSKDFNRAVEESQDYDKYLWESEESIFGFNHAEAGSWLAKYWNFPSQLIASIQYHHQPSQIPGEFRNEALIAHTANYITKKCGIGNSGDDNKLPELHEDVYKYLLSEEDVESMVDELSQQGELISTFVDTIF